MGYSSNFWNYNFPDKRVDTKEQYFFHIIGGATVWPFAGISVFPEKGSAIFWHNTLTDSEPDPFTQHTACAVLLGNKWIGNKWVGYNAQWNQKNCALSHEEGLNPFEVICNE